MRARPLPPFLAVQGARHRLDVATGAVARPLADRMKSVGLEAAGAVGRLARDPASLPSVAAEVAVAAAAAANLLRLRLDDAVPADPAPLPEPFAALADAAGRLADACEKLDHLEDFGPDARAATVDLAAWSLAAARSAGADLTAAALSAICPPAT